MNYTTDTAYFLEDLTNGFEFLQKPLLIWTDAWNKRFNLERGEYVAFIASKGSNNDGASIPKFARSFLWVCPKDKKIKLGAIGHDFIYSHQKFKVFVFDKATRKIKRSLGVHEFTQKEADQFIRAKMKDLGANIYDRNMVYYGLRIGGFVAWNEHRERLIKKGIIKK